VTHALEHLNDRQRNLGLDYQAECDEAGCLDKVFFVLEGGLELWQKGCKITLFDTKKGTNMYGYNVALFVTVDPDGVTRILAASWSCAFAI
jgi:hypothetical protein